MRLLTRCLIAVLVCRMTLFACAGEQPRTKPAGKGAAREPSSETASDRLVLEQEFSKKLSKAVLVGKYSIVGNEDSKSPSSERYEIDSVTKLHDDYWVFIARIQYAKTDVRLPVTLKVLWAGDTPVLSLTNLTIPGLGAEFTCRIVVYGDRYAGTWQHGQAGGHLWGHIERQSAI